MQTKLSSEAKIKNGFGSAKRVGQRSFTNILWQQRNKMKLSIYASMELDLYFVIVYFFFLVREEETIGNNKQ